MLATLKELGPDVKRGFTRVRRERSVVYVLKIGGSYVTGFSNTRFAPTRTDKPSHALPFPSLDHAYEWACKYLTAYGWTAERS